MRAVRTGLITISLLASSTAFAGAPGWSLSETSGQVTVVSTGFVKAALRGGAVAVGDVVNTGRNGRAVLVRGEEYLVIAPNSRIRVADPARTGGLTQIIENFGNVIYKIKKMTMPHFAVETPFLAAVVKGTTFSVTVTDKGTSVQVIEGRVEVATRDGGASYLVLPGDIGSVSASAPGRLNVQGRAPQTIDSPTPAAAAAAVTASLDDMGAKAAEADAVRFDGAIETPVGEGSVKLAAVSDGMVQGDSALMAAISTVTSAARTPVNAEVAPGALLAAADPTPLTAEAETVPTPLPPTPADIPPAPVAEEPVVVVALPPTPAPVVVIATPAPVVVPVALNNSGPGNNNGNGNGNSGNGSNNSGSNNGGGNNTGSNNNGGGNNLGGGQFGNNGWNNWRGGGQKGDD